MTAKGNKKFAHAKLIHEMFKKTLEIGDLERVENIRFNTDNHLLQTVFVNKIVLKAYDKKIYQLGSKNYAKIWTLFVEG